jgi:hypothetical protein
VAEQLKAVADVLAPDSRQTMLEFLDRTTRTMRPQTLEEHHARIAKAALNDVVPEIVRDQWSLAQNTLLYSWYSYGLISVARQHALGCLELAIRTRFGDKSEKKNPGLSYWMQRAIRESLLHDEGLPPSISPLRIGADWMDAAVLAPPPPGVESDPQARVRALATSLPKVRNDLAHGSFMLMPGGYGLMKVCAALINQLWARKPGA